MDGTWVLILLALVMLVGSYVAGSIPLNVSMSEDKLQKVTVFGAGLLVGTALAVIIPEGVRSLFSERSHPTVVTKDFTAEPPSHDDDLHSVIGISLVLGFVFMLLIDQMSSRFNDQSNPVEKNVTATVGLVVHAAADGIALGAAATTSHADVELIVFLAIMLHKAPAAFGLVTFLLHAGLERNRIRKHLLIFSCAAPLLALLTYFGIGNESKQTLSDFNATGNQKYLIVAVASVAGIVLIAVIIIMCRRRQNKPRVSGDLNYENLGCHSEPSIPTHPPQWSRPQVEDYQVPADIMRTDDPIFYAQPVAEDPYATPIPKSLRPGKGKKPTEPTYAQVNRPMGKNSNSEPTYAQVSRPKGKNVISDPTYAQLSLPTPGRVPNYAPSETSDYATVGELYSQVLPNSDRMNNSYGNVFPDGRYVNSGNTEYVEPTYCQPHLKK